MDQQIVDFLAQQMAAGKTPAELQGAVREAMEKRRADAEVAKALPVYADMPPADFARLTTALLDGEGRGDAEAVLKDLVAALIGGDQAGVQRALWQTAKTLRNNLPHLEAWIYEQLAARQTTGQLPGHLTGAVQAAQAKAVAAGQLRPART